LAEPHVKGAGLVESPVRAVGAVTVADVIALVVAAALFVYLVFALIRGERL